MRERLTRAERIELVAELCPRGGARRPCDGFELARDRAIEILGAAGQAEVTADWVMMRAIDRFVSGRIDAADLYRCRILAYYMTFAPGGEEWARWGVAAGVTVGTSRADLADEIDDVLALPDGPPWKG